MTSDLDVCEVELNMQMSFLNAAMATTSWQQSLEDLLIADTERPANRLGDISAGHNQVIESLV